MQRISKRLVPNQITELSQCEIIVFGSNLEGQHMGGIARYAYDYFGAEWCSAAWKAGPSQTAAPSSASSNSNKPQSP